MSDIIRIRVCLATMTDEKILLVPHYDTDVGPIQWNLPGGKVEFGESIQQCAIREFKEETGLDARIGKVIDITEVIKPERPWHSITITFLGHVIGGKMRSEKHQKYGEKTPKWFSVQELKDVKYHPGRTIEKVMNLL